MEKIINIQNQFGKYLLNFIKSRVSSPDDAHDIYQEVIIKIINKSNQLNSAQSIKSWLFTIARNQIIDFYRTQKYLVDLETLPVKSIPNEDDSNSYKDMESCLTGFINLLPEEDKLIIIKSEIEGMNQKDLAKLLGINYVTLRSKVQRGRGKIKKMIFNACVIEKDINGGILDCSSKDIVPFSLNNDQKCGCNE